MITFPRTGIGAIHKGRPHSRGEGGLVKSGHMRMQGGGGSWAKCGGGGGGSPAFAAHCGKIAKAAAAFGGNSGIQSCFREYLFKGELQIFCRSI